MENYLKSINSPLCVISLQHGYPDISHFFEAQQFIA